MLGFAKKLFGSSNDRKVKAFQDQAQRINALEPKFAALSDENKAMLRVSSRRHRPASAQHSNQG